MSKMSGHRCVAFPLPSMLGQIPADILDVQLTCANENSIPFLFTGSGHGFYEGFEELQNGLEIYTAAFYHVDVDAAASTMTIGGSAVFKNVSNALQVYGKNIRKSRTYSRETCCLTLDNGALTKDSTE